MKDFRTDHVRSDTPTYRDASHLKMKAEFALKKSISIRNAADYMTSGTLVGCNVVCRLVKTFFKQNGMKSVFSNVLLAVCLEY